MKIHHKKKLGRIVLGIVILTFLAIILIPKPSKQNSLKNSPNLPKYITHTVILTAKGFDPQKLEIKKGEVVIWSNKSGKRGSVNSAEYPSHKLFPFLNLGSFENEQNVQVIITTTGEFKYVNFFNPQQTGIIIVK